MWEVLLDALLDSLKILAFVFAFNIALSFVEGKIAKTIEKNERYAPLIGSLFGSIPQCGVSVVAADLFDKKHITTGTLIAIFLACSDEALPIVFSNVAGTWYMGFALIGIKITAAVIVGYLTDLIFFKKKHEVEEHHEHCDGEEEIHFGCCHHQIEDENESKVHIHLVHPLLHSLKIFAYVLIINIIFGLVIYFVGEDVISSFLIKNKYLTPLFSWLIGLIPNCASSVILSQAYNMGSIPFSALICGLSVNAGLGMIVLIRKKENLKSVLWIFIILSISSLALGYGLIFI